MPETIRDESGKGYLAKVNADNQLVTRATAVAQRLHSAVDGKYFEASSGIVNLGDAAELDTLYIKYTGDKVLVIDRVFYDTWASTDGVDNTGILKYYHGITSVAGGSDALVTGTNLGVKGLLDATITKSGVFTGGTNWWSALLAQGASVAMEEGRIILEPNTTFGISVQAPTSNTSMNVNVNVAMFEFDSTLIQ